MTRQIVENGTTGISHALMSSTCPPGTSGNITRIMRQGPKLNGQYGVTDDLRLSYTGNQLSSVEEDAQDYDYEGSFDFKAWKGNDYSYKSTYDENGSLLSDEGRKIAYIRYDSGNNPEAVYFTDGHITKYVYSATGQKLRVIHLTAKSNVKRYEAGIEPSEDLTPEQTQFCDTTDYLLGGRLVLKKGRLDRFLFEGGYCSEYIPSGRRLQRPMNSSMWDAFIKLVTRHLDFYYYNQDHLGNVREVVNAAGTVQQVTNYYPFGATYFDDSAVKASDYQPYKFNGKEFDKMYGLNTYDYGARQYDPILARWDRIDPLAEKYYPYSPYVYCANNPVKYIDPDGNSISVVGEYTEEALNQMQAYVGDGMSLFYEGENLCYSITNMDKLTNNAKSYINMIDDAIIDIRISTVDNKQYKVMVGGAYLGHTVEKNENGDVIHVNASQLIDPNVLAKADSYSEKGTMITHEVTEAYEGAKIGQKKGKDDPLRIINNEIQPFKTYKTAHSRASMQNEVFQRSNSTSNGKNNEYYVKNGDGEETVILTQ